ncbi:hypothetical protein [Streptomyces cavernae]|uniref:hypothetical protein n=1 Tax=Streptomyces cavernae TaxID=2259034 RepID=UPI000FEBD386|nr:hypothetical protein [Streptomyces cavernae]
MNTPTGYKQRLASELSAMATHPAPVTATRAPARRLRVPFTIAAVATAAVAAAVVVPTLSGSGSSPAYAVTQRSDGSVALDLNRAEGLPGLQQQLKKLGLPAVVLEGDENCATGKPPLAPGAEGRYPMTYTNTKPFKGIIDPDLIRDGETLLIVADFRDDDSVLSVSYRLVSKVPTCSEPWIGGGPDATL